MNKKLTISTVAVLLLTAHAALAEEPVGPTIWDGFSGFLAPDWDKDLSVTLGTKVWLNEWSRERTLAFSEGPKFKIVGSDRIIQLIQCERDEKCPFLSASDTAPDAEESDIEPVPIPQLSVRYKWLVVNGGYYSKTRFDFGRSAGFLELSDDAGETRQALGTTDFETSGERYEWDASAGIYIHPYVAILGGYKKVRQEIVTTIQFTDNTDPDNNFNGREVTDIAIKGPTIGIAASVPIGGGFGMYGSYAHGFMDTKIRNVSPEGDFDSGTSSDFDTTYNVAEV